MQEQFLRTQMLLGTEVLERLQNARVAVFGIGGVGGFACEALARAGVGRLLLVDDDTVSESNLNRQIVALRSTVGRAKVEVMAERIWDIDPTIIVETRQCFFSEENADSFDFSAFSYVIDAIDTVSAKVELVCRAKAVDTPIVSCMGTGNKLHPELFEITDISKTSVCPLARVMRRELKNRGITHVKVLYSKEEPRPSPLLPEGESARRSIPASISFVPATAGLLIAGEIVRDIAGID